MGRVDMFDVFEMNGFFYFFEFDVVVSWWIDWGDMVDGVVDFGGGIESGGKSLYVRCDIV